MEELVGKVWHRFISRRAYQGHPEARVELDTVKSGLGLFFRAMGGNAALRLTAVNAQHRQARRSWLQRLAGSGKRAELAWRDQQTLMLPAQLDSFDSQALNRDHYYWLAALAAVQGDGAAMAGEAQWFARCQESCAKVIQRYPGLEKKYQQLVQAHLAQRPFIENLPEHLRDTERALRLALELPGSVLSLPEGREQLWDVALWLYPQAGGAGEFSSEDDDEEQNNPEGGKTKRSDKRKHRAQRQEMPDEKEPALISIRHETDLFSLSEMLKIARPPEEDEELDDSEQMADDLDYLTISRDNKASASRVRFDLDLPAAESDDQELGGGKLFPEWDYRLADYRRNYTRVIPCVNVNAEAGELPESLSKTAKTLKRQLQSIISQRQWLRGQEEGSELDMEAVVHAFADRGRRQYHPSPRMYQQLHRRHRDLSTLVLADLSLSTEAGIRDDVRVIDVIRDGLFLFAECLNHIGDRFGIYGFSSRRRDKVRFHTIKGFDDPYNSQVRGQLAAIKPGFYTRMGAAIRQASEILQLQGSRQKLLLIISDGKPNDLDQYEGRYGIEDSRKAIFEARQLGLIPFCITIDQDAEAYLPYIFGANGFRCIQQLEQLPQTLPELYSQLTEL